ncbi:hypothetical protein B0T18DRAFT_395118 [Schizothecium vesticola]|uniref:Ribonuclease H1 N-terminal domain-containing protein n=1 Tax=Schizothecium vesticola TaxID=314040 RepID=A0AA40BR71_9PEZI|nr:hypothetical protein B0T18DRAFT_395118 [Schizothecium vesticola]
MMHKSNVQAERAAGDYDRVDEWLDNKRGTNRRVASTGVPEGRQHLGESVNVDSRGILWEAFVRWYVVTVGLQPGIYTSWLEVSPLVNGFSRNSHQSFGSMAEAKEAYQQFQAARKQREESPEGSDMDVSVDEIKEEGQDPGEE